MNSSAFRTSYLVIIFIALILCYTSFYTVQEGERAIVLRMGKIEQNKKGHPSIEKPGLHFKLPLIEQVRKFDLKLQNKEVDDFSFMNIDKKNITVDYYIKWRISDISLYFTSTNGNTLRAEILLEQQLNDLLRDTLTKQSMQELISGADADSLKAVQQQADEHCKKLGMTIVDLRIKQINLSQDAMRAIYAKMRAERERIALQRLALGKANAETIRAQIDNQVMLLIAKAESDAKKIMAQGDAEAAAIYINAYNQDPNFYAFWRSLDAYKNSFNQKQDILILKPSGQFFKYFNNNVEKNELNSSKSKSKS